MECTAPPSTTPSLPSALRALSGFCAGGAPWSARYPVIRRNAAVRYSAPFRERNGARGAFESEIAQMGLQPRSDTTVERMTAPRAVAVALNLSGRQTEVICRSRRMYANEVPVQFATSYIPADIAKGTALEKEDLGPGGILSRFEEIGLAQVRITESVRVRAPADTERSLLQLDDAQQVLEIWHTGWTADGRPVEVTLHAVPTWAWVLEYEWHVQG